MTIILTNCTNRKKGLATFELTSDNLDADSIHAVAKQWIERLKNAQAVHLVRDTYCGRSFREAEESAKSLSCQLYVVSAGLGIVNSEQKIPLYNLTVSAGVSNSILDKIGGHPSAKAWWSEIVKGNPFGTSLQNTLEHHPDDLILIALSSPYIELLNDELLSCPIDQQQRFRFFGKQLNSKLPECLVGNWMPYDDRLDCTSSTYSGTQTDFAQRALRHFVNEILNNHRDGGIHMHRKAVIETLSPFEKPVIPKRLRQSDQEIGIAIRNNWVFGKGQSSVLLRIIRRDLNIACEQSRFKGIYHEVKNTIGDPK
jgi:hypothetical protein